MPEMKLVRQVLVPVWQLAPNREIFSLLDADPANAGNYLEGTGIRRIE